MFDDVKSALRWLETLGGDPKLIRHSEIVAGVCGEISAGLDALDIQHDADLAVVGAALHDAGKVIHPEELTGPGCQHETAGRSLLLNHGVPAPLAEMCVAHADWSSDSTIEQLMVAVADQIWRGKRPADLERLLVLKCAERMRCEPWQAMLEIDPLLERIASKAEDRLAMARSPQ